MQTLTADISVSLRPQVIACPPRCLEADVLRGGWYGGSALYLALLREHERTCPRCMRRMSYYSMAAENPELTVEQIESVV
jgi:hypothetical protein